MSTEVAFRAEVFDWCVRRARRCREQGTLEAAAQWLEIAARHAVDHAFGAIASREVEAEILAVAAVLPPRPSHGEVAAATRVKGGAVIGDAPRWLHVFSQVYEIGGHTVMAARWFVRDRARRHSALLLGQPRPAPQFFLDAVQTAGGQVHQLDRLQPLLARARRLREVARAAADVVVLHVHPWEIAPTLAFALPGGPPVVLVNHADHAFWAGGSVIDLVLDLRRAGAEWTRGHRGIPRSEILPIVVPDDPPGRPDGERSVPERAEAKARLGLPPDSLVLLTVARAEKYVPLPACGLDFLAATQVVLQAHPRAWLLAVGPDPGGRWEAARRATGGRVRAEGVRRELAVYHAAADIFLESFPFGSATALLEAAIRGIPCVRAPRSLLPPLGTGGPGVDGIAQPEDAHAYARETSDLLHDEPARQRRGASMAAAVAACHGKAGWLARLDQVVARIPAEHATYSLPAPQALAPEVTALWAEWSAAVHPGNALVTAFEAALERSLEPHVDRRLRMAMRDRNAGGGGDDHRLAAVRWAGPLLALLRARPSTCDRVYRSASYFLRQGGRLQRTVSGLARLAGHSAASRSA